MTYPGSLELLGGAVLEPVMGKGGRQELQPREGQRDGAGRRTVASSNLCSLPPTMQRLSLVRDKCFLSATECLQKIM